MTHMILKPDELSYDTTITFTDTHGDTVFNSDNCSDSFEKSTTYKPILEKGGDYNIGTNPSRIRHFIPLQSTVSENIQPSEKPKTTLLLEENTDKVVKHQLTGELVCEPTICPDDVNIGNDINFELIVKTNENEDVSSTNVNGRLRFEKEETTSLPQTKLILPDREEEPNLTPLRDINESRSFPWSNSPWNFRTEGSAPKSSHFEPRTKIKPMIPASLNRSTLESSSFSPASYPIPLLREKTTPITWLDEQSLDFTDLNVYDSMLPKNPLYSAVSNSPSAIGPQSFTAVPISETQPFKRITGPLSRVGLFTRLSPCISQSVTLQSSHTVENFSQQGSRSHSPSHAYSPSIGFSQTATSRFSSNHFPSSSSIQRVPAPTSSFATPVTTSLNPSYYPTPRLPEIIHSSPFLGHCPCKTREPLPERVINSHKTYFFPMANHSRSDFPHLPLVPEVREAQMYEIRAPIDTATDLLISRPEQSEFTAIPGSGEPTRIQTVGKSHMPGSNLELPMVYNPFVTQPRELTDSITDNASRKTISDLEYERIKEAIEWARRERWELRAQIMQLKKEALESSRALENRQKEILARFDTDRNATTNSVQSEIRTVKLEEQKRLDQIEALVESLVEKTAETDLQLRHELISTCRVVTEKEAKTSQLDKIFQKMNLSDKEKHDAFQLRLEAVEGQQKSLEAVLAAERKKLMAIEAQEQEQDALLKYLCQLDYSKFSPVQGKQTDEPEYRGYKVEEVERALPKLSQQRSEIRPQSEEKELELVKNKSRLNKPPSVDGLQNQKQPNETKIVLERKLECGRQKLKKQLQPSMYQKELNKNSNAAFVKKFEIQCRSACDTSTSSCDTSIPTTVGRKYERSSKRAQSISLPYIAQDTVEKMVEDKAISTHIASKYIACKQPVMMKLVAERRRKLRRK